jgi:hypothetical protein
MSSSDVFAERLAVIDERARAEMAIHLLVNSIKEMRLARLSDQEIVSFFRYAADELDTATPLAGAGN